MKHYPQSTIFIFNKTASKPWKTFITEAVLLEMWIYEMSTKVVGLWDRHEQNIGLEKAFPKFSHGLEIIAVRCLTLAVSFS